MKFFRTVAITRRAWKQKIPSLHHGMSHIDVNSTPCQPHFLGDHLGSLVRSPSVSRVQDSCVPGNWSGLGEKVQTENAKIFAAVVKRETFLHP